MDRSQQQRSDHAHLSKVYEDRRSETSRIDVQELSSGIDSCAAVSERRGDSERHRGFKSIAAASARQESRGVFGSFALKEHGRRRIFQAAARQIASTVRLRYEF